MKNQSLPPHFPVAQPSPLKGEPRRKRNSYQNKFQAGAPSFLVALYKIQGTPSPVAILIFQSPGRVDRGTVQQSEQLNYQPRRVPKSFHLVIDQTKV